jgi:amino acid adenylation domain-containing protein
VSTSVEDVLPLTPLQEGLLFHARFDESGPDVYTMQLSALLSGPLDVAALRASCAELVARHQALRACFRQDRSNRTVQVVRRTVSLAWRQVDLSGVDEPERELRLTELLRAAQAERFDLAKPPLLRFMLVRLAPDRHRFVVTNHHIVVDGWSTSVLTAELFQLYARGGDGSGLPAPRSYRDFFQWLAGRDRDAATAAWGAALAGLPGPTLLAPADPARLPVVADEITVDLPTGLCDRLRELARARGLTMNTIFQVALGLTLGTATGRDDVVFGATVAGRPPEVPGIEGMVGMFINTVPVRVRVDRATPVAVLLAGVQAEQAGLVAHQHLGLVDIQRAAGQSELFDTHFVFQNAPAGTGSGAAGLRLSDMDVQGGTNFTLSVTARHTGEGISLDLEYRQDLFDLADTRAFAARLVRVLAAVVADPDAPAGRLDPLSAEERAAVRAAGTGAEVEVPWPVLPGLPAVFAERVAATPDAVAVVCGTESLSYRELDVRSDRLARALAGRGVGPERLVALLLPRSADWLVAMLAVWKAGGAYLPLDPTHPAERLRALVADARPVLAVTTTEHETALSDLDTLVLDRPLPQAAAALPAGVAPSQAAYLIYTSGSTGRPKGVLVSHGSLANLFTFHRGEVIPTGRSRAALVAPLTFDASWNLLFWLFAGHELHILDDDTRRDAHALVAYARAHRIDALEATPTHAEQLLDTGLLDAGVRPSTLLLGGEAITEELWARVRATGVTAVNVYGPTECAVDTVTGRLDASDRPVLGSPLWNTRAYVLDAGLRLVPPRTAGELYLAGAPLARGYHHNPALTAERFVADPYGPPGTRMYRTGDLARWTSAGTLEFLGRVDDQVKIRGYRVEPGEIEAVLTEHETVTRAVTLVRDGRLVAYLVPGTVDLDAVRAHAAARLPEYMVPAAFVALDAFPLGQHGKLDRRALPDPDLQQGARAPRTPRQEILCGLFAEVLGLDSVGVDDDFFALGGHSLLATRFVGRARRVFGIELSLRTLFQTPTVAGLDAHLATGGRARPEPRRRTRQRRPPLSFAQRRLWFLNRLEGPSATYNICGALRLRGDLDPPALAAAFQDVLARHEALRTVFPDNAGEPYQRVLDTARTGAELVTVECAPDELPGALRAAAARPFDVTAAEVPIRATLFAVGPDEHVLLVVVHHIAADGWSIAPLMRDLGTAYAARRHGHLADWAPLPVRYVDYTLWQQELLGTADDPDSLSAAQLSYWDDQLAGLPECLALPVDRPRPAVASHRGANLRFRVDAELHARLAELARATGVTQFMVVHAALAALLTRLGAGTDIPVGTPLAGRTDQALDELVGFFVNTAVLRTDLSGDPTFRELLARVRETDLAAYAHQDIPFEQVVEHVNPRRSLAWNPLFQVLLVLQVGASATGMVPGLEVDVEPVDTGTAKVDLTVRVNETSDQGGLEFDLEYAVDLFDRPTVARFAAGLTRLLAAMADDPDTRVGAVDLVTPEDRTYSLAAGTGTVLDGPRPALPDVFADQVTMTPDAVAVVCGTASLTYRELDARSDRLARALAGRGVGPERLVALLLPRSADWLVAVLAVWKAGGAYLPLDPTHPVERVRSLVADARPVLGLTITAHEAVLSDVDTLVLDRPLPEATAGLPGPAAPSRAAYVLYTSGSTGRPKGVVVTHDSLANLYAFHRTRIIPTTGRLRAALVAPLTFDASWNLLFWLFAGHELHILDDDTRRDTHALVDHVRTHRIDALEATPTHARQLLDAGLLDTRLSTLLLGGEAIPGELWHRVRDSGVMAVNVYGPTECTVDTVVCPLDDSMTPTLGRPLWNTCAYVLDAELRFVPPGTPGELYLAGVPLARGYHRRPAMTADRFVADPYGPPGTRMYRTGDLARWTSAGTLEFLGRTDHQVKIRGHRVEPGEVEAVLTAHETVARALVLARDGRLVAYLVPNGDATVDVAGLRALAGARLPDYLVPAGFAVLTEFPLTANGKLDRQALPVPDAPRAPAGREPRTPREVVLCGLFAEVLGLDSVSIDDDFFVLGGHSLLATRLISRVRTVLEAEISVRDVFQAPTVAGLSALLGEARTARTTTRTALRRMSRPANT